MHIAAGSHAMRLPFMPKDARVIPGVAYTDPEVAWVGLTARAKPEPSPVRAFCCQGASHELMPQRPTSSRFAAKGLTHQVIQRFKLQATWAF